VQPCEGEEAAQDGVGAVAPVDEQEIGKVRLDAGVDPVESPSRCRTHAHGGAGSVAADADVTSLLSVLLLLLEEFFHFFGEVELVGGDHTGAEGAVRGVPFLGTAGQLLQRLSELLGGVSHNRRTDEKTDGKRRSFAADCKYSICTFSIKVDVDSI